MWYFPADIFWGSSTCNLLLKSYSLFYWIFNKIILSFWTCFHLYWEKNWNEITGLPFLYGLLTHSLWHPMDQTTNKIIICFEIFFWNGFSAMQDLAYREDNPANLYTSTFGHGAKKLESLIALILIFVQISSPLPLAGWDFWSISTAEAVLYSPDTKVPRTGELALRRAIPANANMKAIQVLLSFWICLISINLDSNWFAPAFCFQSSLEDISFLLRIPQRKPYGTMEGNVKKALKACIIFFHSNQGCSYHQIVAGQNLIELLAP